MSAMSEGRRNRVSMGNLYWIPVNSIQEKMRCVFVRQYPRRLVVESPGGFPVGITSENVLDRQSPRNRRIADVFAKFCTG